mgnify:CR=1 FL=1
MASRDETRKMKGIVDEYGLRDYRLDEAGDPVIYSRTRGANKDELFLYSTSGSCNLAAFIYGTSPRKLGSKVKKLAAIGCEILQQSTEEATVLFSNAKIGEVSKLLKCDRIIRKQSQAQIDALKRLAAERNSKKG